eukprot:scaffold10536_cov308-Chaetoceros_neogracile.AAC.3
MIIDKDFGGDEESEIASGAKKGLSPEYCRERHFWCVGRRRARVIFSKLPLSSICHFTHSSQLYCYKSSVNIW